MFPSFHCTGVLEAGLDREGRDIHRQLAGTPVCSIRRMVCLHSSRHELQCFFALG